MFVVVCLLYSLFRECVLWNIQIFFLFSVRAFQLAREGNSSWRYLWIFFFNFRKLTVGD